MGDNSYGTAACSEYKYNRANVIFFQYSGATSDKAVYNDEALGYNSSINSGGDQVMDIEKYIDRLDQDRRDMENRLREDRQLMEQRMAEDRRLSESRMNESLATMREESRLREERLETRFRESMANIDKVIENIDSKIEKIDSKIDKAIDDIDNSKKWVTGLCITTIIGIATMVITMVLAITFS